MCIMDLAEVCVVCTSTPVSLCNVRIFTGGDVSCFFRNLRKKAIEKKMQGQPTCRLFHSLGFRK